MKKFIKVIMTYCVLGIFLLSSTSTALAAPAKEGDITWEVKNQVLYIKPVSGTKGVMKNYKLSSKKPWSNKKFDTIRIEKGVSEIGKYAFANTNVKKIELPDEIETIKQGAFYGSENLQYLKLPSKCAYIGHEAFANSSNKNINFVMDYNSPKMIQMGVNVFEGIHDSKSLTINIKRIAHMINFQYDAEHGKLYDVAQFNVVEKTHLKEVSAPNYTYEYYTGKPIIFEPVLRDGLLELSEGIHYTAEFSNNVKPGKATITYTGIGQFFTGTKVVNFEIKLPEVEKFKASSSTTNSVKLTWSPKSAIDGYEIQRYDSKTKKYKTIKTLKNTTTSFTDKDLKSGVKYKYRIRTYKTIDKKKYYSSYAPTVSKVTLPKTPSIKLSTSSKSVKVSWSKISEATGYRVYYSTSEKGDYKLLSDCKKNTITSYTKKGLTKGKKYYFKVRSYKTIDGKNYYSNYSTIKNIKVK